MPKAEANTIMCPCGHPMAQHEANLRTAALRCPVIVQGKRCPCKR